MGDLVSHALRRMLLVAVAGLLLLPAVASAAPPPVGGLTQLSGPAGCFGSTASAACQVGNGISSAEGAVVSPDGRYVYATSNIDGNRGPGLSVFSRDPGTGQLTQLPGPEGCLTADGSGQAGAGTCTQVNGFGTGDGRDFAITSDGRWAYLVNEVAGGGSPAGSIVIFKRDPATGVLTQPSGTDGCISSDGSSQEGPGMCRTQSTLGDPSGISISPDDRFLYVNDYAHYTVQTFARNGATGELTEVQCLSAASTPPTGCTAARNLGNAQSVVISPDGMHAYTAGFSNGISILDRDPATGMLTQPTGAAGCISDAAENPGSCATGRVLNGAYALDLSPDGRTLYVTAYYDNGISIFHVNPDGSLTQPPGTAGCITLSGEDDTGSPTCALGRALENPYGSAVSRDGHTLYVTEDTNGGRGPEGGIAVFSLDSATGDATQLPGAAGCITADGASNGTAGACATANALGSSYTPAVSPDGTSVYVASFAGQSLTAFEREPGPACQSTTASTAYQTPVTVTLSCTDADGDPLTRSIVSGPAHGSLGAVGSTVTYTPANGYTGTDSFTFDATDGTNASAPATVTITVGAPAAPSLGTPRAAAAHVTKFSQSHRRWREGKHGGTTFSFNLNETARVVFTFTQPNHERILGRLTVAGHSGRNRRAFNGLINRHTKLKPGTYTVTITTGASSSHRLTFTIVK